MTTGATPAGNTAFSHDRGSTADTFQLLARLLLQQMFVGVWSEYGRCCVLLHRNMPPAPVVIVTFNGNVTAGMC